MCAGTRSTEPPRGRVRGAIAGWVTPGERAHGGDVRAGRPYIVGEDGIEVIVPRNSGTVIPNDKLTAPGVLPFPSGKTSAEVVEQHIHYDGWQLSGSNADEVALAAMQRLARLRAADPVAV